MAIQVQEMQSLGMHREMELEGHMHREMELEGPPLSWANEVTMLGERAPAQEVMEGEVQDEILMVEAESDQDRAQGFSLMMMEASQNSLPMMVMGQEPAECRPIRPPSTVLSLQSTSPSRGGQVQGGSLKKRGRQKGPGKPKSHYVKERELSFQMLMKLPLKSRKLFCVAEFYKYMARSSSDSLCKLTEAYSNAGESVGVSGKTARKWVEDWERRADGTFSESQQGKHVKVEWLLQPEHLQSKARAWIDQNCPKRGEPPRKESVIKMFRDFCNNELLLSAEATEADQPPTQRKISTETARSWLHRLGFNNFKDFKKSSAKSVH